MLKKRYLFRTCTTIFLNISPRGQSIISLLQQKQIDIEFMREVKNKAWDSFFLFPHNKFCTITSKKENDDIQKLELKIDNSISEIIKREKQKDNHQFQQFQSTLSNRDLSVYFLFLILSRNGEEENFSSIIINERGFNIRDFIVPELKDVLFFHANPSFTNKSLAAEYDKAQLNNLEDKALEIFQIIDPNIERVKSLSIGQPTLYLKQKDKEYLPIGLFGDAIKKVSSIILTILNSSKGDVLLIDEIENGIHYTNQEQLWQFLLELAEYFDVQIFATTHSIEMINAFHKVLEQPKFSDKGKYFDYKAAVLDTLEVKKLDKSSEKRCAELIGCIKIGYILRRI